MAVRSTQFWADQATATGFRYSGLVPVGHRLVLRSFLFTNMTNAVMEVQLRVVTSGGEQLVLYRKAAFAYYETVVLDHWMVLNEGDKLAVYTSVACDGAVLASGALLVL